jgi:phosphate acetyltransferase
LETKKQIENKVVELGLNFDFRKIKILIPLNQEHDDYNTHFSYEVSKCNTWYKDLMEDVCYFGTMVKIKGHADGMFLSCTYYTTYHTAPVYWGKNKAEFSVWFLLVFLLCIRGSSFCV